MIRSVKIAGRVANPLSTLRNFAIVSKTEKLAVFCKDDLHFHRVHSFIHSHFAPALSTMSNKLMKSPQKEERYDRYRLRQRHYRTQNSAANGGGVHLALIKCDAMAVRLQEIVRSAISSASASIWRVENWFRQIAANICNQEGQKLPRTSLQGRPPRTPQIRKSMNGIQR